MRFKAFSAGLAIHTLTAFKRGFASFLTAVAVSWHGYTQRWRKDRIFSQLRMKAQIKKPAPDGAGLCRANFGEFTVQIPQI